MQPALVLSFGSGVAESEFAKPSMWDLKFACFIDGAPQPVTSNRTKPVTEFTNLFKHRIHHNRAIRFLEAPAIGLLKSDQVSIGNVFHTFREQAYQSGASGSLESAVGRLHTRA